MSPDQEATLVTEEDKPPIVADVDAASKPPPEAEPEASIEMAKPPEKSASERRFDEIMELPEDERNAAFSDLEKRMEEKGIDSPWRKRQEEANAAKAVTASRNAERERKQADIRGWQSNSDAARANLDVLVNDLHGKWEKRAAAVQSAAQAGLPLDGDAPRFDTAEYGKQLDTYAGAKAQLMSLEAITEIGNAMNDGLAAHGGALTDEELTAITAGVSRADKVRAYMDALASRVKKEVAAEMENDIVKRIERAVANETGAMRAEANRGTEVAPATKGAAAGGATKSYLDMTREERAKLTPEQVDAAVAALAE